MNKTSLDGSLGFSGVSVKLGVELESIEETGVGVEVEKMESGSLGGQHGHGKPGIPIKNLKIELSLSATRTELIKTENWQM